MIRTYRLTSIVAAVCLSIAGYVAAGTASPGGDNAAKPVAAAKRPANLNPQVAALQKEWQAYARDPGANKLRETSDYFKTNPSPDATPDVVMKALEASVSGGAGAEAYVKWQLLSAVPGKFPDELVKRAIVVYRRSPAPTEHPGLNHRLLSKAVMGVKKSQAGSLQKEMDEAVARVSERNHVLFEYRDALFSRLPNRLDVLQAGLEDVADRASRGLNANGIFDNVSAGIRSWAISDAKPAQVSGMTAAVSRLRAVVTRDENRPYAKIGDDKGMAKWDLAGPAIDPKKLDELAKFLENNSSGGMAGGLKFKENKDK
ncbi:MAG TPA: hypothetical protein VH475_29240 [Tepidisphaeraceae bacterium]|jgi:hypothetical protein